VNKQTLGPRGGISTPLIVHWPQGIAPQRRGQLEPQPGHLIDIMATCVDLARRNIPASFTASHPTDAGSFAAPRAGGKPLKRTEPPVLGARRQPRRPRRPLEARRQGGSTVELYDMERDRTEMHDLAAQQPDRVKAMAAQWDAWARGANVQPLGRLAAGT
jgi:arylsulfatase